MVETLAIVVLLVALFLLAVACVNQYRQGYDEGYREGYAERYPEHRIQDTDIPDKYNEW